ncbi:hypothetical protein BIW11_04062 [Tropilaelaps mercedesae]|uniref:Uncharacterized protein n=1 Tax=Tropilaelaps mercedesae TaxID=418985 RepID=A0A1V9XC85_9ACAR|nr:hypothetical protein BIW11_04062 [Tropilaelaps mercedesae]
MTNALSQYPRHEVKHSRAKPFREQQLSATTRGICQCRNPSEYLVTSRLA